MIDTWATGPAHQCGVPHHNWFYTLIKTATTSSDGWLRTTVPAKTSGLWRIRYGGNTIAGGAVAAGDYVKVS